MGQYYVDSVKDGKKIYYIIRSSDDSVIIMEPTKYLKHKTTEYVYVADYAEVYHFERSCTHILLSVRECRAWEIEMLRNESGEKYSACERCASRGTDLFYITPSGDRYHTNPECGGLKRTIRKITRAEAESRYRMCGRCGR